MQAGKRFDFSPWADIITADGIVFNGIVCRPARRPERAVIALREARHPTEDTMKTGKKAPATIAIIIGGVVVLILVAVLLLSSWSRGRRFDSYMETARIYISAENYDKAAEYLAQAKAIRENDETRELEQELLDVMGGEEDTDDEDAIDVGTEKVAKDAKAFIANKKSLTSDDIEALSQIDTLTSISLRENRIDDISALADLTELTSLALSDNDISDLTPLAGLKKLKTLYLDGNPIEDFTPLYGLKKLSTLSIRDIEMDSDTLKELQEALPDCKIFSDGSAEEEETEITIGGKTVPLDTTELDLRGLNLTDISELAKLTNLQKLDLRDNKISDISALSELSNLTWLCLWNNKVSDVRPLMSLTQLTYLDLDGNQVSDVSSLSMLTGLKKLWLSNNPIDTISPLRTLTGLTGLGLNNTGLNDAQLKYLEKLTSLTDLRIEKNPKLTGEAVEALEAALPGCAVTHSDLVYETPTETTTPTEPTETTTPTEPTETDTTDVPVDPD